MLRAAALENDSPAQVLQKTNTLIVANAESGMFVTGFYAILNTRTGVMTFASGGHNPPILARANQCTVEPLSARGIALGVLEDIHLEERKVELGPGDSVVFYTDGVTDAINEREEDFGMPRLLATVKAGCGMSSDEMITSLTEAVARHVGGESQFDDFTLVVLTRAGGEAHSEQTG
jgi:sigma-B regulation protein RsbU (phosphoserine phosphatase)